MARPLPGVRFVADVEHPGDSLPRMDVACFLGFARKGPVDTPVALESPERFDEVFGLDQILAWDPREGEWLRAHLRAAVHQFFANGGRRCWVVRVLDAATARKRHFQVPSVLEARLDGTWKIQPVSVRARDFGSWADDLRAFARTENVSLRCERSVFGPGGSGSLDLLCPERSDLVVGDLVRVALDERTSVFFEASSLSRGHVADDRVVRTEIVRKIVVRRVVEGASHPAGSCSIALMDRPDGRSWTESRCGAELVWKPGRLVELTSRVEPELRPPVGGLLKVRWDAGGRAWARVVDCLASHEALSGGKLSVTLVCQLWEAGVELREADLLPALSSKPSKVDRIRLRLAARGPDLWKETDAFALAGGSGSVGEEFPLELSATDGFLLPLGDPDCEGAGAAPLPDTASPLERDGLGRMDGRLLCSMFLDGDLASELVPGLLLRAEARWDDAALPKAVERPVDPDVGHATRTAIRAARDQDEDKIRRGRSAFGPRGIHSLLAGPVPGPSDEATLVAAVDCVHPCWAPVRRDATWWNELEVVPVPTRPKDEFRDLAQVRVPVPGWIKGAPPDADGRVEIAWKGSGRPGAVFRLEEAVGAQDDSWVEVFRGEAARHVRVLPMEALRRYRVRETLDGVEGDWSVRLEIRRHTRIEESTLEFPESLEEVHRALLRVAAARGDLVALLSVPRTHRVPDLLAHARSLRDPLRGGREVPAIGVGESKALAQGMLSHPWIRSVGSPDGHHPPEGALAGLLARTALREGAWIAPGRQPLAQAAGTDQILSDSDHLRLREEGVSPVGVSPRGVFLQWSDTLAREPEDRHLNVRRLMGLLRRLLKRHGDPWVFEPAGPALVRQVERSCQRLLSGLHRRGALRGNGEGSSWHLAAQADGDRGELRVELGVAPSVPLTWLSVRLTLLGERLVAEEAP